MDRDELRQATEEKVGRRNAESIKVKLELLDQMVREQNLKISSLNNTLSTIYNRLNDLENRMNLEKIKNLGNGPSVR